MIVENAQVVAIDGQYAVVQTQRRSACHACSVNRGCGIPVLNSLIPNRICSLKVLNPVHANIGDKVEIGVSESGLVKGALILYVLPLISVVVSIVAASVIFGSHLTDSIAIAFSVAGFILGLGLVGLLSNRLGSKMEYQTKILSVTGGNKHSSPVFLDK